jgi:hypothetical protein
LNSPTGCGTEALISYLYNGDNDNSSNISTKGYSEELNNTTNVLCFR